MAFPMASKPYEKRKRPGRSLQEKIPAEQVLKEEISNNSCIIDVARWEEVLCSILAFGQELILFNHRSHACRFARFHFTS